MGRVAAHGWGPAGVLAPGGYRPGSTNETGDLVSVDQLAPASAPGPARPSGGWGARIVRAVGWVFIAAGTLVLLFLVYLLWFTDIRGDLAQREVAERFELEFGDVSAAAPATDGPADEEEATSDVPIEIGDAWAAMRFERDGRPLLHDEPLYVVEGTDLGSLRSGPGHYPETADPGEVGNVGVAGHRTTNGAPFGDLDQLAAGDLVHVVGRDLREWTYEVRETQIVRPSDGWVIGSDPLDEGGAWLTLTTCHPRFSNAQRMVVFASLVGQSDGEAETTDGGDLVEEDLDG